MNAGFVAVERCWVCGGAALDPLFTARYELSAFAQQDPPLAAYTGVAIDMRRCRGCGFAQPAELPALERYFDRIYDQQWADYWVEAEHHATYKDLIFDDVLDALDGRVAARPRRLLDVGAHAGRLMSLARARGWDVEGVELNPRTAAQAAASTGAPVHWGSIQTFEADARFDAVTIIDVLEHIPEPRAALARAAAWLRPGGAIVVKVPNGGAQRLKEAARARVRPGYRPTLADNLVHINHFTPAIAARGARADRLRPRDGLRRRAGTARCPARPPGAASDFPCRPRRAGRAAHATGAEPPGCGHPPMSRTIRATITALFGYLRFGFAILTGLWLVPFTLHHVSARMYGFWLASGELVAYAALAEFGVLVTVPWLIAEADGAADRGRMRALVTTAVAAALVSAAVSGLAVVGLLSALPSVVHLEPGGTGRRCSGRS